MKQELKTLTMKLRKERSPLASTMVFHLAEVEKIGKNAGNRETTEDEAIQYVKKTVQKLNEDQYSNKEEATLLEGLLPQMASREEVQTFLATLEDTSNKGVVMKAVKQRFGTLVDMKMVAGMV